MEDALNHYLRAVDNMDGTALEQSTTAFLKHNRFLEEANTAIRNFCQTTPPVAVDTTSTCPDAQERAYFSIVSPIMNRALPNLKGFFDQITQAVNNPLVITLDEWTYTTAAYAVGLEMYIESVRELSPPDSAKRVHDPLLRSVGAMEEMLDYFVRGVDNRDEAAIERSFAAMLELNRFIEETNTAMGDFCK